MDIFYEIEKHFKFDSSYVLDLGRFSKEQYLEEQPFTLENLMEVPIVPKCLFSKGMQIKSGGTYLRFFSGEMIKQVMLYNLNLGFTPLVYLHPYDYLVDWEFWVPINNFLRPKQTKNLIKYLRQI